MRLTSLLARAETLIERRGLGYVGYLVTGVALPKVWYRLAYPEGDASPLPRPAFRAGGDRPLEALRADAQKWGRMPAESIARSVALTDVVSAPGTLRDIEALRARGESEPVLAERARDGSWKWTVTSLDALALPSAPPSPGIDEQVVLIGKELWLRRTHPARGESFAREAFALTHLRGVAGVPALREADPRSGQLLVALTRGRPLAAALRTADADLRAALLRAADLLLHRIHGRGVTGFATGEGAILVDEDGTPFASRFDASRHDVDLTGRRFAGRRDVDRLAFNRAHGASLITEAGARQLLSDARARLTSYEDYAPIDFGGGLTLGRIATTDSGTGRWEFFNGSVVAPLVAGKRVLDLGSNNGSMPTAMLRAGAREVTGVEMNHSLADLCELSSRIFEWRDMRPYALSLHRGSMTDFLQEDWGTFDVVTAFCSLYYLSEEEMAAIVRRARGMGATMILQSNEGIDDGLRRVASAAYLRQLLVDNGYGDGRIQSHCPSGYTRVLLTATPNGA